MTRGRGACDQQPRPVAAKSLSGSFFVIMVADHPGAVRDGIHTIFAPSALITPEKRDFKRRALRITVWYIIDIVRNSFWRQQITAFSDYETQV